MAHITVNTEPANALQSRQHANQRSYVICACTHAQLRAHSLRKAAEAVTALATTASVED
jgi:hypothetical protein